jgi:CRP/FNR family transcriptional regulator
MIPSRANFDAHAGCTPEQQALCHNCGARPDSVCSGVPDESLAELARATRTMQVPAGTVLVAEGDPADQVFNLVAGCAKVSKMLPDGRQQIVGFLGRGDFVGLAIDRQYGYTVEAVTAVQACRFSRAAWGELLAGHPGVERRLRQAANHELAIAQEQMLALGRKTAVERLAGFLLQMQARANAGTGTGAGTVADKAAGEHLLLPMTRAEIADYLGLTIETISRTFTRLKRDQLIRLDGAARVQLLDATALREIAGGWRS